MEAERVVGGLRLAIRESYSTLNNKAKIRVHFDHLLDCPIQLDPHRTIATACKILASDPTIPDGERIAGALMQMTGAGNAKPYEVCDE